MSKTEVIAYGYVIADTEGRVQLHTLRSNRSKCWCAFVCADDRSGAEHASGIRRMKKMGFRAVAVWVKEAFPKT